MDKREFREKLKQAKRVVIKIGSGVIAEEDGINIEILENITNSINELINQGKEIIIVSSGAVACGMNILNLKKRPDNIVSLQALAGIGQPKLIDIYEKLFEKYGLKIAQLLITIDDIQNRRRFINAKNALLTLIKWKIIPIINENDTVVIKELRFGDNDNLSFHILNLAEADALIILSNIDGVYSKKPTDKDAVLIEKITKETDIEIGENSKLGSGGIKTKIEAGLNSAETGKLACIINGKRKDSLRKLFEEDEFEFTFFEPTKNPLKSRKSWILNCSPSGVVVIDDGAKESIRKHKSLLPSGVVKVFGGFGRGDIINIEDKEGRLIAKGITNYDSSEIEKIKGKHSKEIVNILGYKYSDDIIHTDNMSVVEDG
ncbi:glutamate 5-kinase [Hippea alviniae]|uniref:glutamate 5-kinase n=1 Tax=Hippea alviniae TaxID=1279027 RepID=UPI0003B64276|nr:glutamate 5-kinase [Hippea alviniae]